MSLQEQVQKAIEYAVTTFDPQRFFVMGMELYYAEMPISQLVGQSGHWLATITNGEEACTYSGDDDMEYMESEWAETPEAAVESLLKNMQERAQKSHKVSQG